MKVAQRRRGGVLFDGQESGSGSVGNLGGSHGVWVDVAGERISSGRMLRVCWCFGVQGAWGRQRET